MSHRIKIILVVLVAILAIVGFVFVVENHQSKELKVVSESPMSNLQLTTGDETKRSYYDRGTTLGMPEYVTLHISYQPRDGYTKLDVYTELVKKMKETIASSKEVIFDGEYDGEKTRTDENYYSASFSYKKYLRLDVDIYEPKYSSEENTILLNIENHGRYPEPDFLMAIKDIFTL